LIENKILNDYIYFVIAGYHTLILNKENQALDDYLVFKTRNVITVLFKLIINYVKLYRSDLPSFLGNNA